MLVFFHQLFFNWISICEFSHSVFSVSLYVFLTRYLLPLTTHPLKKIFTDFSQAKFLYCYCWEMREISLFMLDSLKLPKFLIFLRVFWRFSRNFSIFKNIAGFPHLPVWNSSSHYLLYPVSIPASENYSDTFPFL